MILCFVDSMHRLQRGGRRSGHSPPSLKFVRCGSQVEVWCVGEGSIIDFIPNLSIFSLSHCITFLYVRAKRGYLHHIAPFCWIQVAHSTFLHYWFTNNADSTFVNNPFLNLLSPRNALRWGYSNAAVVPCVRVCVVPSVRGPCEHDRD